MLCRRTRSGSNRTPLSCVVSQVPFPFSFSAPAAGTSLDQPRAAPFARNPRPQRQKTRNSPMHEGSSRLRRAESRRCWRHPCSELSSAVRCSGDVEAATFPWVEHLYLLVQRHLNGCSQVVLKHHDAIFRAIWLFGIWNSR